MRLTAIITQLIVVTVGVSGQTQTSSLSPTVSEPDMILGFVGTLSMDK